MVASNVKLFEFVMWMPATPFSYIYIGLDISKEVASRDLKNGKVTLRKINEPAINSWHGVYGPQKRSL